MKGCERHQNLSKEDKGKMWEYGHERYKNFSENEKNKLVKYKKKSCRMRKSTFLKTIRKYFN